SLCSSVASHWACLSVLTDIPTCCFTYISRPVPRRIITSAYRTSETCLQPAVVLVTRKGRKLCANPKEVWVQKFMKDLK
ncbi:CCL3 protein, partial [Scytalopus superciliaris]|nr:CCL3 protein [Scytalopus superciliaris]